MTVVGGFLRYTRIDCGTARQAPSCQRKGRPDTPVARSGRTRYARPELSPSRNDRSRRISPVTPRPSKGLLTKPITALRSAQRELVFMPLSGHIGRSPPDAGMGDDSPFIRQHQERGCANSEFIGFAFSAHRAGIRSFERNLSPVLQVHRGPVWLVNNALPFPRCSEH